MRLFIGIPLSADMAEQLAAAQAQLKPGSEGFRWTPPESWHITLQFLGETAAERCACVIARLRQTDAAAVRIVLEGLGSFAQTGVVFAAVVRTPALLALQRITVATARCGVIAESKPFTPHITLARARGRAQAGNRTAMQRQMAALAGFSPCTAQEFVLYESFLEAAGARYQVRERFPLKGE